MSSIAFVRCPRNKASASRVVFESSSITVNIVWTKDLIAENDSVIGIRTKTLELTIRSCS